MTTEENKALVRSYLEEVWNGRNPDALERFYPSPDLDEQEGNPELELPNLKAAKEYISQVQAGFPDLHVDIDDIIAEGDKVAIRTTWRSSQQEELGGIVPSSNMPVEVTGNAIWRIVEHKIVELEGTLGERVLDELGMLEYLVSPGPCFFKFPPWRCQY
jgi:predicted ester cyclase